MVKKKFLRADTFRHSRIGKNRRKLEKWRRPRGKHNKLRLKRFGHPVQPGVGFKKPSSLSGKINGLRPVLVHNPAGLKNLDKNSLIIIARVGAKNKIEIIKKAEEMKLKISNLGGKK